MLQVGPRISSKNAEWLEHHFGNRNKGAEYLLGAFPELYRRCISDELRGTFTVSELSLLLDTFNATMLIPQLAGQHLLVSAKDAIRLDQLDKKWDVDAGALVGKIQALSICQRAVMEIWLREFWESGTWEREDGLEEWTGQLA